MKVSLNWVKRFVDLKQTADEVALVFPKIGLEIESIERKGCEKSDFVVVGQITDFEPHPNADRLRVCRVDVGDGQLRQIVCGAKNFQKGDCVPVALPGAVLPGKVKIKRSKLRGIESEGMMCSARELGLGSDHAGLLILEKKWPLGTKIHEIYNDDDVIFDLELTANRGDALCHYGVARELAAWYDLPLKPIDIPNLNSIAKTENIESIRIEINSPNCECYYALLLKNITIQPSVDWVRRDLESVGVAVINNVVDTTNWVMLAYGQPLHAFDRKSIGDEIVVRQAVNGEKMATLDGKTHELDQDTLLITDGKLPIAIAGIIGGEQSKIDDSTREAVLEGACFVADNVRRSSRKLGIATDSTYRYARHVDAARTKDFSIIAAEMLHRLYDVEIVLPISGKENADIKKSWDILLDPKFVRSSLGFDVSDADIEHLLRRLQYGVRRDGENLIVTVPSYRWDVTRPIDLVEECLRIYGVDKIPDIKVCAEESNSATVLGARRRLHLLNFLVDNGFSECYNYSLTKPSNDAMALDNPLLDDQTHFRSSLLPGLLQNLQYNFQNDRRDCKLCEIGHVVQKCAQSNTFEELVSVAFVMPIEAREEHWNDYIKPSFFDAKNLLGHLWKICTDDPFVGIIPTNNEMFQEHFVGQIGDLEKIGIQGFVGYLNSEVVSDFKMPIIAGELFIKLSKFDAPLAAKKYKPFGTFPAAKRDISIIVERDYPAQSAIDLLRELLDTIAKPIFSEVNVSIFDVYTGENIASDQKNLGINLAFYHQDKTPSEEEIDRVFEQLVTSIKSHPVLNLRGM